MHRRIFGQLIPFALEMDAEQLRRKASSISLKSFSIEEMRVARGILSSESTDMDNKNPELKYYIELLNLLSVEERLRPISQQFPFPRCDIDILLKVTENLLTSTDCQMRWKQR